MKKQAKYLVVIVGSVIALILFLQIYIYKSLQDVLPHVSGPVEGTLSGLQIKLLFIGILFTLALIPLLIYITRILTQFNILIVDDDKTITNLMHNIMIKKYPNSKVYAANDGFKAGEILGSKKINLLLLDIKMPGIDGFGIIKLIQRDPSFGYPRIIIVTGCREIDLKDRLLHLGVKDIVYKPFEIQELLEKIKQVTSE